MEDKLLYKHIILYILLLLLPVVAFSGFIQISILEKIRQNYTYQLENRMIYCANDLEEVFSSLDTVRTNVIYSRRPPRGQKAHRKKNCILRNRQILCRMKL